MESRAVRLTIALAALCAAAPAAAQRISVGAIQDERGTALSKQLTGAVCDTYECVPRKQVVTSGKVDFAKMRAKKVSGFLLGSVIRKGGTPSLWIALLRTSDRPSRTWTLPVGAGTQLDPAALDEFRKELGDILVVGSVPLALPAAPPAPEPAALEGKRIALGAVSGEGASPVTRQLSSALCKEYACVPRGEVVTKGKVDFAKMRKKGVAGFTFGSVTGAGATSSLWLALTTGPDRTRSWKLPLAKSGTLSPGSMALLLEGVRAELGGGEPQAAPVAPAPSAAVAAPPPPAPAPVPTPARAAPAGEAAAAAAPAAAAAQPAPAPEEKPARRRQYLVAVEAGAFFTSRSLTYSGAPAPLGYDMTLAGGPWVGVEFFPVSLVTNDIASGIGLVANYGTTVGLKGTAPTGDSLPSTLWWLRLGAEWRFRPMASSEFSVVPAVSYLMQKFTVSPPYPGLPNTSLSGIEGSLRFDIPVMPVLSVLAGASYVYWFSEEDLVGNAQYFPAGSAWGLEAEVGLSVRVWGPLSVRGLGTYSLTTYTLTPTPATAYQSTGASDRYIGGRVTVRGEF